MKCKKLDIMLDFSLKKAILASELSHLLPSPIDSIIDIICRVNFKSPPLPAWWGLCFYNPYNPY